MTIGDRLASAERLSWPGGKVAASLTHKNSDTPIGYTAVSQVPICTNQGFVNFICGKELLPEFLAYWLRTQKEKMLQQAGGTTFKEIARGTLRKFEISYPPLDEQRRIVDLLARSDDIVFRHRTAQQKASELHNALLARLFSEESH